MYSKLLGPSKHIDQKLGKKNQVLFVTSMESLILVSIFLHKEFIFIYSKYKAVMFKQLHETDALL